MRADLRSLLTIATAAALLVAATPAAKASQGFAACLAGLRTQARKEGISAPVIKKALGDVRYDDRVMQRDRHQPEFISTFSNYLDRHVTAARVARGRALLRRHRNVLRRVSAQYGVPAQYLLAFWGLETDYGRFFGNIPTFNSLTTLACDPRRRTYFTEQLMAALKIVQRGDITPAAMIGSWAGAIGDFQFMPTAFLKYAVDYDDNGQANLWSSVPDAMASAANFLRALGWQRGVRWGREVRLPKHFPYYLAGLDKARPLSAWRRRGVTQADGHPLPQDELQAALLVPAGHRGPAFLVYHNFRVIMDWNRSEFYALSVGYLADRIAGAGPLTQPPPADEPNLSKRTVQALQSRLNQRGYNAGRPDGILGPTTREAIRAFQRGNGMIADGYPSPTALAALGAQRQPYPKGTDSARPQTVK